MSDTSNDKVLCVRTDARLDGLFKRWLDYVMLDAGIFDKKRNQEQQGPRKKRGKIKSTFGNL